MGRLEHGLQATGARRPQPVARVFAGNRNDATTVEEIVKEKAMHERFVGRLEEGLQKLQAAAACGRLKDEAVANRRLGRLHQRFWRSRRGLRREDRAIVTPPGQAAVAGDLEASPALERLGRAVGGLLSAAHQARCAASTRRSQCSETIGRKMNVSPLFPTNRPS